MTIVEIDKDGAVKFAGDLDEKIGMAKINGIIGTRVTMSDGTIIHFRLRLSRWQVKLLRCGELFDMISIDDKGRSDVVTFRQGLKWAFVSRNFADVCSGLAAECPRHLREEAVNV